jgi:hypothetical protein
MVDQPDQPDDGGPFPIELDVAKVARVENFLAGGDAHFAIDRAAAESIGEVSPGGIDGLRELVRAVKTFVTRTVTVLTGELGVRQYLHIGMSTPTNGMVHHVAGAIAPGIRVVYASYDPTTLAHVHTLARDSLPGAGAVAHVHSRHEDTPRILREAAATLDFDRPVAVVLPTTLTLVPDDQVAQRMVDDLRAAITPGSYLVFAHTGAELVPEGAGKAVERYNEILDETYVLRSRDEIAEMLAGFRLIEPGLVATDLWRPDVDPPAPARRRLVPIYGAVGRKPDDG